MTVRLWVKFTIHNSQFTPGMSQLPEKLLQSLQAIEAFDRDAFERVHASGERITSIRVNPEKNFEVRSRYFGTDFELSPVPWCQYGYYLKKRPSFTFDPLFHAGCYYVQEASSMFLEQAVRQTVDLSKAVRILDLSAAPGGKSTHIQSLISEDSLLVSNEVIKSRVNILQDNLIKWGSNNVVVTSNDPKVFGRLRNYFDAVVVDAPCSGSGLFRRDEEAIDQWSENNVQLCSQRQQRILADVWPALKKEGILIYSTCSYSQEENESILNWMVKEFAVESCELRVDENWNIDKVRSSSGAVAYRFWPYKVKGEGFFVGVLRKTDGEVLQRTLLGQGGNVKANKKVEVARNKDIEVAGRWVANREGEFLKNGSKLFAIPRRLMNEINVLADSLHILYYGTAIGEIMRDKLIPDHALALSKMVSVNIEKVELSYNDAITYLKRKELENLITQKKGWQMVTYQRHALGWINVLSNRINNYYPKHLRILKDI
jgi:16S rRNA C967 or C1407 C5-methylase (RsmB/RsmF family)/NOL1/NOP2/fmu family ribosome biogenesis protein